MASHLSGRTTVVTGAVGGLGFALTIGILQEGSDVVCLDLPAQPPEELWIAITAWAAKSNTIATYHHCDVTNEEEIKVVLEKAQRTAQERNHPIRGLVAGAGIQKMYDAMEFPVEEFRKVLDINVTGSFLIAKHAARIMKDTNLGGSIILVASIAGYVASRVCRIHDQFPLWLANEVRAFAELHTAPLRLQRTRYAALSPRSGVHLELGSILSPLVLLRQIC